MSEYEDIAKTMHEAYERLAPEFGYTTRSESAVPWEMVPKNSRALMVAAVTEAVSPLLTRVAELEAENRHLAIDLACWKHSGAVTFDRAEQAEAELAERDRMLRIAHKTAGGPERSMSYELWLADLRARAEEGSET